MIWKELLDKLMKSIKLQKCMQMNQVPLYKMPFKFLIWLAALPVCVKKCTRGSQSVSMLKSGPTTLLTILCSLTVAQITCGLSVFKVHYISHQNSDDETYPLTLNTSLWLYSVLKYIHGVLVTQTCWQCCVCEILKLSTVIEGVSRQSLITLLIVHGDIMWISLKCGKYMTWRVVTTLHAQIIWQVWAIWVVWEKLDEQ
jgi:hypothetical protein